MDLIYQYYRLMPGTLDEVEDMWEMVKSILTNVMIDWKNQTKAFGRLEEKDSILFPSKVMCWVALDRGGSYCRFIKQTDIPETLVGRSDRNQRKCHEKRLERRDAKFLANLR